MLRERSCRGGWLHRAGNGSSLQFKARRCAWLSNHHTHSCTLLPSAAGCHQPPAPSPTKELHVLGAKSSKAAWHGADSELFRHYRKLMEDWPQAGPQKVLHTEPGPCAPPHCSELFNSHFLMTTRPQSSDRRQLPEVHHSWNPKFAINKKWRKKEVNEVLFLQLAAGFHSAPGHSPFLLAAKHLRRSHPNSSLKEGNLPPSWAAAMRTRQQCSPQRCSLCPLWNLQDTTCRC